MKYHQLLGSIQDHEEQEYMVIRVWEFEVDDQTTMMITLESFNPCGPMDFQFRVTCRERHGKRPATWKMQTLHRHIRAAFAECKRMAMAIWFNDPGYRMNGNYVSDRVVINATLHV